ncbi:MAG: hypothetical protein BGO42_04320 [Flavobacterium sp. 40-81]|uniref:hypothetical protein n=1 Tax=Flavobacterium sp. 40-81 TaxID=1896169 RepID=UPI00095D3434|nr:hypothetical protein [Flavobacterium sp. 40-81]OJV71045.1 MAG: hypothetical protein BGO42_04320 [Flavobacterium sp. 40-81]
MVWLQIFKNIIFNFSFLLKNPEGKKHALYDGSEKSQYTCKYCGYKSSILSSLTSFSCSKSLKKKASTSNVKSFIKGGETTFDIFNPKFI